MSIYTFPSACAFVWALGIFTGYASQDPVIDERGTVEIAKPDRIATGDPDRPRPIVESRDGWGIWSNLQGRTTAENTYESMRIISPRRHVWSSSNASSELTPITIRNVVVLGNVRPPLGYDGPLWMSRLYNVTGGLVEDSRFYRAGNYAGTFQFEGHAHYWNVWGDVTFRRLWFEHCLGQALQLVWRENETLLSTPPQGRITIEDVRIKDCSRQPGDRASYPISIANPGQEVWIRRTSIWTTRESPTWRKNASDPTLYRSRGGLAVWPGDGHAWRTPLVRINKLNVVLLDSDRPAVKLTAAARVEWQGGYVVDEGELGWPATIIINPQGSGFIRGLTGNYRIATETSSGRIDRILAENKDYTW